LVLVRIVRITGKEYADELGDNVMDGSEYFV